jgi:predicted nucleic acid-binding protein
VQLWLQAQAPEDLAISDWVITEVSSALALKVRTGALQLTHRADALALFNRLLAETLTVHPVHGAHFRAAARFADRHELGLRAGDALHLALAADLGCTLATLDRRLEAAGAPLGVPVLAL